MLPSFSYVRPETVKDTVKHASARGAALHAGGTDLIGCLREGIMDVDKVVSLSALADLYGIRETADDGLTIGALATITEVAENPLVRNKYPGLAQGASEVASPQLRNQGTLGGNLCQKPRCWYYRGEFHCLRKGGDMCYALAGEHQFHAVFGHDRICVITHPSDTAPVLAALGAKLRVAGPDGGKTIAVENLHVPPRDNVLTETVLGPGEVITRIDLPRPAANLKSSYRKVRARRSWDFALAGVALALEMDGDRVENSRVFLSGAAPIPWRSRSVENVIRGRRLDDKTIAEARAAIVENADPLPGNTYKLELFKGVIEEELSAMGRPE
ncbi:MAG: xanthine dehydrogenase family protein subunit M [Desulfobacterales bacterium]|nr:xanthine dehydrogenase family protein subunit M [Desulfobacterales bacterium]